MLVMHESGPAVFLTVKFSHPEDLEMDKEIFCDHIPLMEPTRAATMQSFKRFRRAIDATDNSMIRTTTESYHHIRKRKPKLATPAGVSYP